MTYCEFLLTKWWSACRCDTKTARSFCKTLTMFALPKWRYSWPHVFSPQSSSMLSFTLPTQHRQEAKLSPE